MNSRAIFTTPSGQVHEAATLDELFRRRVAATPDAIAYRYFERTQQQWRPLSWREMAAGVARWQSALAAENLPRGARVAIALRNGPEWVMFDQAALSLGLVVVPLYVEDRPDNIAFCLADSGASLLLLQDHGRVELITAALEGLSTLRRIVVVGSHSASGNVQNVVTLEQWLPAEAEPHEPCPVEPRQLTTLVYTSGTAGRPKGVMLSHHTILSVTRSGLKAIHLTQGHSLLSFLPLSHMYERTVGCYVPMMAGAEVAYARSVNQLAEDLATLRPTHLVTVPRLLERVHSRIEAKLASGSPLARALFRLAVHAGWLKFERQQGRRRWSPLLLIQPLLQRLVGRKIVERLGGRMQLLVSGGAPLPFGIARTFIALGVPIVQGYGLSETSPQVCVNRPENNEPLSAGLPLQGTEFKIGAEDELLIRGDCVMLGYWNNPAATAAAIDPEGWFHSGDQGAIVDGRIYITGRLKDILVLSNGEKIPPAEMECAIAFAPLIDQVLVVGEGHSHLSALVVLNPDEWPRLAKQHGLDPTAPESLTDRTVIREVLQLISAQLHDFPGYAKVRRAHLTLEPWSLENGLMTATMKLKRNAIIARYQSEIDALYR